MKMLADEVTEMNDYGYFIDIDNGTVLSTSSSDRHIYEKEKVVQSKSNPVCPKECKHSLFCLNTFCCVAVSFLFLKLWVFTTKN